MKFNFGLRTGTIWRVFNRMRRQSRADAFRNRARIHSGPKNIAEFMLLIYIDLGYQLYKEFLSDYRNTCKKMQKSSIAKQLSFDDALELTSVHVC